jgi:N-methylhydantoinase A
MTDQPRYRIGVDVGGTHTDLVLLNSVTGSLTIEKVPSTPANPALAVLDGVGRFIAKGVDPAAVEFFSHGTTITTNALLQMRGARVGLMISAGYRAIQEVQNQARDGNPFDYFYKKPEPIAPQSLTREIPGRIDFEGNELIPLDEDIVRRAARELVDTGAESIAICYLFSFMNPTHEDASRKIIEDAFPDIQISTSSQVMPRIREWPRLSTTLMNAYLEPVLVRYILDLANGLDDIGVATPQRFLMQSNGGVMPFTAAISGGRSRQKRMHGLATGNSGGKRHHAAV